VVQTGARDGHQRHGKKRQTGARDGHTQRETQKGRIAKKKNGRQPGFEPETWSQRFQLKPVTSQDK